MFRIYRRWGIANLRDPKPFSFLPVAIFFNRDKADDYCRDRRAVGVEHLMVFSDGSQMSHAPMLHDEANLLEACKDLLESVDIALTDTLLPDPVKEVLRGFLRGADQRARAAIAKAEGGTP